MWWTGLFPFSFSFSLLLVRTLYLKKNKLLSSQNWIPQFRRSWFNFVRNSKLKNGRRTIAKPHYAFLLFFWLWFGKRCIIKDVVKRDIWFCYNLERRRWTKQWKSRRSRCFGHGVWNWERNQLNAFGCSWFPTQFKFVLCYSWGVSCEVLRY